MPESATIGHVIQRVEALREKYRLRDARAAEVRAVRRGEFDKVAPDLLEANVGKGFALMGLGKVDEALQLPGFAARLKELV